MSKIFIFDWGDTLMIDFPGVNGKMFEWNIVEAVEGAEETLSYISKKSKIYVASGALDSTEIEIKLAFKRVGLDKYISGYFCRSNTGADKGTLEFLSSILNSLNVKSTQVTVVGDNLQKDIEPALALGINTVWYQKDRTPSHRHGIQTIAALNELCL